MKDIRVGGIGTKQIGVGWKLCEWWVLQGLARNIFLVPHNLSQTHAFLPFSLHTRTVTHFWSTTVRPSLSLFSIAFLTITTVAPYYRHGLTEFVCREQWVLLRLLNSQLSFCIDLSFDDISCSPLSRPQGVSFRQIDNIPWDPSLTARGHV